MKTVFSIKSMILREENVPFYPDDSLEKAGKILGVPDRWDFGIEKDFFCQLGYGDFEINIRGHENRVKIERIWVKFWDTLHNKPKPKERKIVFSKKVRPDLGVFEPGLSFAKTKGILMGMGLRYIEIDVNDSSETVKKIITENGCEVVFFNFDNCPVLMEIHFFSQKCL